MKKILIIISVILLASGCYNYQELNDYAIATGMAIDYEDDQYEVSMLISNSPKSSNEGSSGDYQTVVYSGKGDTIYDAIKEIGLISPKEIYFGHLSIVILSEDLAKKGINSSLEFLLQEPRSKKNFYVALAKDAKAKDILSISTPLTDFPSETLANNIKITNDLQGSVVSTNFNTLLYYIINDGVNPVLNGFKLIGNEEKGAKTSNTETNLPKAYVKLTNLGIFKGDKLVSWASKDESRGINIINDHIRELYIQIKCDSGYIVIATEKMNTTKKVDKKGNVTVNVKGNGAINEITCNIDLSKQETIKEITNKVNKKVKSFAKKGIKISQKYKTDLFGIGLKYYQEYPKSFKKIDDWNEYYANIDFKINVDVNLNSTGSIEQTLERVENEENN